MEESFTSAPAAPAAAGGSTPSAPAPSSGGSTGTSAPASAGAPAPGYGSPDPGLSPLAPPGFQAPPGLDQATAPPLDQGDGTVAAPPPADDLPEDDVFSRLSGQERATHWSTARQRIAELNGRVAQAAQAQSVIQEWGGPDQVKASLDLLGGLMSPVLDEQGNVTYGEDGLPETTSSAFWQQLRERSPQLFVQAGEDWLHQEHSPGIANWQVMFQSVFGLDPNKLDLYRQVTDGSVDTAKYLPASDVPAWELEDIPQELQNAYKATDPDMRQELQTLSPQARDRYLQEKQSFMEERQSREMREQEARQAYEAQRQEADRRLANEAATHALDFRRSQRQALKDELSRSFSPTADPTVNDRIRERCLDLTEHYVNNDPQVAPLVTNADYYMRMAYVLDQQGDQVRAASARREANNFSTRALGMVRRYLSEQVSFENQRSTGFREGWDQQREQARGRTVLPRSEANGLASGSFAPKLGAAPFTEQRYSELSRQLQQDRQFRSEGY